LSTSPLKLQYIRGEDNKPIGCIVAFKFNNYVLIGFSKLHPKDIEDPNITFSKKEAQKMAIEKAINIFMKPGERYFIPDDVMSLLFDFAPKCLRYFKEISIKGFPVVLPEQNEIAYMIQKSNQGDLQKNFNGIKIEEKNY